MILKNPGGKNNIERCLCVCVCLCAQKNNTRGVNEQTNNKNRGKIQIDTAYLLVNIPWI